MAANGNDSTTMMLWPGSSVKSKVFTVEDVPIRIIGAVPSEARVKVWRMYDKVGDDCELFKVDPTPVMCCDSCDQLSLFTVPYTDCYTGFLTQNEILIESSGTYYLEYCCAPEEDVIIPPLEPTCGTVANVIRGGGGGGLAGEIGDTTITFELAEATSFDLTSAVAADFTADGTAALSIAEVAGKLVVTFASGVLDGAVTFAFVESVGFSIISTDGLYMVCDFTSDISEGGVTCGTVTNIVYKDPFDEGGDVYVHFDVVGVSSFDTSNIVISDFTVDGTAAIGHINYTDTLSIEFAPGVLEGNVFFEYIDSGGGSITSTDGTITLCDFNANLVEFPPLEVAVEDEPECVEVPDGVHIWRREEYLRGSC